MPDSDIIEDLQLLPIPAWWQHPVVWVVFLLLVGLALYGLRWWLRRNPRPTPIPVTPPGPPPHPEFLKRLKELRERQAELTAYELAIEVAEILREYLECRFHFAIRYQTTREFLTAASSSNHLNTQQRSVLASFLGACDTVKFARHSATPGEQVALLDAAESLILQCAGIAASGSSKRTPAQDATPSPLPTPGSPESRPKP